jgi:SEC-C motif-containing protein
VKKRKLRRAPAAPAACPCGRPAAYADCCAPLHDGSRDAGDALELVRSRFSAFATGRADYVWQTMHSTHDDRARGREAFVLALERALGAVRFRSLRILDSRAPDAHGIARVLFAVDAISNKRDASFVEQSDFVQEAGKWRYIVGQSRPRSALTHELGSMTLEHWQCAHGH